MGVSWTTVPWCWSLFFCCISTRRLTFHSAQYFCDDFGRSRNVVTVISIFINAWRDFALFQNGLTSFCVFLVVDFLVCSYLMWSIFKNARTSYGCLFMSFIYLIKPVLYIVQIEIYAMHWKRIDKGVFGIHGYLFTVFIATMEMKTVITCMFNLLLYMIKIVCFTRAF